MILRRKIQDFLLFDSKDEKTVEKEETLQKILSFICMDEGNILTGDEASYNLSKRIQS